MAIIQSILVGKGKGKIGNVVLSNLKGQTVAKQLNSSPSNPQTVAQTSNRVKMANAVVAWQFLSLFFSEAKALRKPLESTYNAFVRITKVNLNDTLYPSRAITAEQALTVGNFVGNWFPISVSELEADKLRINLSTSGVAHSETMRVRGILIDNVTGEQLITDRTVTLSEFTSGQIILVSQMLGNVTMGAAYIYDTASSKITNVAYKS